MQNMNTTPLKSELPRVGSTDSTVLRPGAQDAYALPSLQNGKAIPRTRPTLMGSSVPLNRNSDLK